MQQSIQIHFREELQLTAYERYLDAIVYCTLSALLNTPLLNLSKKVDLIIINDQMMLEMTVRVKNFVTWTDG